VKLSITITSIGAELSHSAALLALVKSE